MFRQAKDLENFELHARDGTIGKVKDLYFDDAQWFVRYFVVDTGSWLNSRQVLVSPVAVHSPDWKKKELPVDLTQDQVRHSPGIDTAKPVSRQHESELNRYYGWPYYWAPGAESPVGVPIPVLGAVPGPAVPGPAGRRDREAAGIAVEEGDPHLRSIREMRGYTIKAIDGSIGHVDDLLVDDQAWEISHLVIDTRNWWPGKKVILSPHWISGVSWADSEVSVDLSRDAIKASPEYDASQPASAEYVDRLHDFYKRPRYRSR